MLFVRKSHPERNPRRKRSTLQAARIGLIVQQTDYPANLIKLLLMFIIITVALLFLTGFSLLLLRVLAPQFRYTWLIATGGGILAWISVFAWQTQMPIALQFSIWQPSSLFSQSPTFIADEIAWVFSLSIVTLCLAIIIT